MISIEQNSGPHIEQKCASFNSRLIPALPGQIILPSMETKMLGPDISTKLRRVAWLLRARDVEIKLRNLAEAVGKANFNPNEPRVPAGNPEGGQWTTGGGGSSPNSSSGDTSSYHIVQLREASSGVIPVSETIAPGFIVDRFDKTGDPLIDTMTALLLNRVAFAHVVAGRGAGAAYGSRVHTQFATTVRLQEIPGVEVEQSFDNEGDIAKYGADGSVRTDVILRDSNSKIIGIWDLKTGTARLEPKRVQEIRKQLGAGTEVPVIELHIGRGATNKRRPGVHASYAAVASCRQSGSGGNRFTARHSSMMDVTTSL